MENERVYCWSITWSRYLFLEKPDATARHRRISIKSTKGCGRWLQEAQISNKGKVFPPLYRLPLSSFAWLMTGILQTNAVCLLSDQVAWKLQRAGDSKLLWISASCPIPRQIQSQRSRVILSPHITQSCQCQSPQKTACTHKAWLNQLPHAYMTEVGLGRIQALGPKWVAGYGPYRKCALLWGRRKKKKGAGHWTITSCPGQQSCTSGTADQLANCRAHLLREISIGSLVEPEDSKCSRWPGNLHWSVSHDSCSWSPIRRCNFVPFWCLLGDLVRCSLCLESQADSDRWPAGFATSSCGTAMDPGGGLVSKFSILHRI